MVAGGVSWMIAYALIIRRGFREQTYGMPLAALCANLSWEAIFSLLHPHYALQRAVNFLWLALDLVILYQALRFGPREWLGVSRRVFYAMFGLALVTAFCAVLFLSEAFQDSGACAAFGQNLLMSVLFISMLYRRGSLRGQSLGIAIAKLWGTAFASMAFFFYSYDDRSRGALMVFLYVATLVYDLIYVGMVRSYARAVRPLPGPV